jgi:hypothetical protein
LRIKVKKVVRAIHYFSSLNLSKDCSGPDASLVWLAHNHCDRVYPGDNSNVAQGGGESDNKSPGDNGNVAQVGDDCSNNDPDDNTINDLRDKTEFAVAIAASEDGEVLVNYIAMAAMIPLSTAVILARCVVAIFYTLARVDCSIFLY